MKQSPEAFEREEEEEECLLDGECGGHRRGEGPEIDPLFLGLCRGAGPGRTRSRGILESGYLGSNPSFTVPNRVMMENCLSSLIRTVRMQ